MRGSGNLLGYGSYGIIRELDEFSVSSVSKTLQNFLPREREYEDMEEGK